MDIKVNTNVKGEAEYDAITDMGTNDEAFASKKYVDDNSSGGDLSLVAELEAQIKIGYITAEFNYTSGVLTSIDYNDVTPTTIYTKVFTYTSGVLTSWVITRISDSTTLTCTFSYTAGVLTEKNYS